jgi:uncharacterized membrane protein YeaQ/YmgE (transglycosylase-associated protein family)
MGNALAALLYLGFGAGWSAVASAVKKNGNRDRKRTFVSNMVVGSTGAWLGGTLFGALGPSLYGVSLIATAISSLGAIYGFNKLTSNMDKPDQQESPNER